jgi:hypothetical protein
MKYTIEMASCGVKYISSLMKVGTSVQAIIKYGLRNMRGCNAGTCITDVSGLLTTPMRGSQVS